MYNIHHVNVRLKKNLISNKLNMDYQARVHTAIYIPSYHFTQVIADTMCNVVLN